MRVVLYGPPLAGKWTLLEALALSRRVPIQRFEAPTADGSEFGDRVLFKFEQEPFEVATFRACLWDETVWYPLLASANVLILVLDPQETVEEANRKYMIRAERIKLKLDVGCVVVTKQDLVAKGVESVPPDRLLNGTLFHNWPVFKTRMDRPATLREPFDWVVRQAENIGR